MQGSANNNISNNSRSPAEMAYASGQLLCDNRHPNANLSLNRNLFVRSDSILTDDDYVPFDAPTQSKFGPISRMSTKTSAFATGKNDDHLSINPSFFHGAMENLNASNVPTTTTNAKTTSDEHEISASPKFATKPAPAVPPNMAEKQHHQQQRQQQNNYPSEKSWEKWTGLEKRDSTPHSKMRIPSLSTASASNDASAWLYNNLQKTTSNCKWMQANQILGEVFAFVTIKIIEIYLFIDITSIPTQRFGVTSNECGYGTNEINVPTIASNIPWIDAERQLAKRR